jgi:hypothetical protein
MSAFRSPVAGALAALALAACHPRQPLPQTNEGEWALAREAETRRVFLYDGLIHRATATATHLSWRVREARARRLSAWYGWTQQELDERLAKEREEAAAGEEFFLAFYTAEPRENDLDAPRSIWRVAAKIQGVDLVARRVTSVERDATVAGLFPYLGPFDVAYVLTLPRAPSGDLAGRPFVLEIASAVGRVALDFTMPDGIGTQEPVQTAPGL